MLISIIIPAYNVQDFIIDCIESLLLVNLEKEIIVIDDGSTDDTFSILRGYKNKHSCIKIFSQKNQGSSSARNKGVSLAKGKFLAFIDSDDYINPNNFKLLVNNAHDDDLDVMYGSGYRNKKGKMKNLRKNPDLSINKTNGIDLFEKLLKNKNYLPVVWLGIYKRDFLLFNNLLFNPDLRIGEDCDFTIRVLLNAKTCAYKNIPFYFYNIRSGTLSSTDYAKDGLKIMHISINNALSILKEYKIEDNKYIAQEVMDCYFYFCKSLAKLKTKDEFYFDMLKVVYDDEIVSILKKQKLIFKKRIYLYLIRLNFNFFCFVRSFKFL